MPGYICLPYASLVFAFAGDGKRTICQVGWLQSLASRRTTKMTAQIEVLGLIISQGLDVISMA
jgi:hypothetical protein